MIFLSTFSKVLGFLLALSTFILLIAIILNYYDDIENDNYFGYYEGNIKSKNTIAILNINGPIIYEPINNYNFKKYIKNDAIYPSLINKYLKELEKEKIIGLIISINSPGGSVSATNEIYNLIKNFKIKNKIPLYFHSTEILASGAYWLSLAGDKIYTNYGAIIGSIGVKGPDWIYYNSPNLISNGIFGSSVESNKGIKLFSNIAGQSKDIFNPFREPTLSEIKQLQNMINNIYEKFINIVSSNRKLDKKFIINNIGAMIYNSSEAEKKYLIDGQKNIKEILQIIKKQINVNDFKIITNNNNYLNFYDIIGMLKIYNNHKTINEELIRKKFCNNIKNEFSVAINSSYLDKC